VNSIYNDLTEKYMDASYLRERAILTPTNDIVDLVNNHVVSLIPGEAKQYLSCDRISKAPGSHESLDILYLVEFLNSLNGNNFPTHELILKKGVPIMLLRNINQSIGLCNGTRLIVTALGNMVIEAQIMTGTHIGRTVLIPRISQTLKNTKLPFTMERRQLPIKIC
jgi:ATP-dependent DNA helicase PIF1